MTKGNSVHLEVDLPFSSFMRSKYGEYKQYHTSEDIMDFISKKDFKEVFNFLKDNFGTGKI